jgi:hypothetical protein
VMYFTHGTTYLESFFADQVGDRVSSKTLQTINNAVLGFINLIAFSIPWIIIAFSKPRELKTYITNSDNTKKSIFGFIILWVILIIIMAGAVFKFYDRYILPVIPLFSLFMAFIFVQSKTGFKKSVVNILLILNLLLLTVSILYAVFILPATILIVGIITAVLIITIYFLGVFKNVSHEVIIANGILLLYFSGFILMYPLIMPNPGKQLVIALTEQGIKATDKVYVYGNIRAASNIRIHSKNQMDVISMDTVFTLPNNQNHFLVFDKKQQDLLDLKDYKILKGSEEWVRVPVSKFPVFLQQPVSKIKESGTTYLIAKPIF